MNALPGERNGRSLLTERAVVAIRLQYADGVSQQKLADAYKVSVSTINAILHGRTWRHSGGPILGQPWSGATRERVSLLTRGERHPQAKLTEERVRFLREWHAAGWSIADLARAVGVSKNVCRLAVRGATWGHVR